MEEVDCGIYNLEGVKGKSAVKIKPIGLMKLRPGEHVRDTPVKAYEIDKSVIGEIVACNITNSYLVSTRTLPMLCATIYWLPSTLRKDVLYRLYLNFTIESEINSQSDMINKKLYGKYSLEVGIGDKRFPLDDYDIKKFKGIEKTIKMLVNFTQSEDMKDLLPSLIETIKKQIAEQYGGQFEYDNPPKATVRLADYL